MPAAGAAAGADTRTRSPSFKKPAPRTATAVSYTHLDVYKRQLDVWTSHGDRVTAVPEGFSAIARTAGVPITAMADEARRWDGVQFHPEVTHTCSGELMLRRFVFEDRGCRSLWTAANIIEDQIARVRALVGDDEVILGLSGGVDSSVVAALLHRAIGDKLTCVFVDTGLLRWQEGDQVMAMFAQNMGVKVLRVNAAHRYFDRLQGVDVYKRQPPPSLPLLPQGEETSASQGIAQTG